MSIQILIKMGAKELVKAAEKIGCCVMDGIRVDIMPKMEGMDANPISFTASDKVTQVTTIGYCEAPAVSEPLSFFVDKAFVSVVTSLGVTSDCDFELCYMEDRLAIKLGSSVVPVGVVGEATLIEQQNVAENSLCALSFDTEEFVASVKKGAHAYSPAGCRLEALSNMVAFLPLEGKVRVISANEGGNLVVMKDMAPKSGDDSLSAQAAEGKVWLFNATFLTRILPFLEDETTEVYIMESQYLIRNGSSYYLFVPGNAAKFPVQWVHNVYGADQEREFSFSVSNRGLKDAIMVAALNPSPMESKDSTHCEVVFEEGRISVTNYSGANITVLAAEGEGEVDMAFISAALKRLLSCMGDTVTFSGMGASSGVYVKEDGDTSFKALIMPQYTRAVAEASQENEDSEDSEE